LHIKSEGLSPVSVH